MPNDNIGMTNEHLVEISSSFSTGSLAKRQYWSTGVYGLGKHIREYAYYPSFLPLYIETDHGPDMSDKPNAEKLNTKATIFFMHSISMINKWKKLSNIPCYPLFSPFVFYRRNNKVTQNYDAKGTIAFFHHALNTIDVQQDTEQYAKDLLELPEEYHPVSVCLFYADILQERHKVFRKYNIPVYSAGHARDARFTERFYDIIRKFKYGTAPCISSSLYYCIEMGMPAFIHGKMPVINNPNNEVLPIGTYRLDTLYEGRLVRINQMFSQIRQEITEEQRELVESMLGIYTGTSRLKMAWLLYKTYFDIQTRRILAVILPVSLKTKIKSIFT